MIGNVVANCVSAAYNYKSLDRKKWLHKNKLDHTYDDMNTCEPEVRDEKLDKCETHNLPNIR